MKVHGIPQSKKETKLWAITNLHGYYILQDISSEGIQDLIERGYNPEHVEVEDPLAMSVNTLLKVNDLDNFCEIITFHDEDQERVEARFPKHETSTPEPEVLPEEIVREEPVVAEEEHNVEPTGKRKPSSRSKKSG